MIDMNDYHFHHRHANTSVSQRPQQQEQQQQQKSNNVNLNPVEEDVDFDLAKGYMEGLRISQLKTNRPLPAQFTDGNDDADNLEIVNDKKNQIGFGLSFPFQLVWYSLCIYYRKHIWLQPKIFYSH